eukprot:8968165-Pyramimonas_sp.AAC.1
MLHLLVLLYAQSSCSTSTLKSSPAATVGCGRAAEASGEAEAGRGGSENKTTIHKTYPASAPFASTRLCR